jgi:hypothetical protein
MRIAFLFDNSKSAATALDRVAFSWISGLAESQHDIKVITNRDHLPPESISSPRITWAQAMNSWSLFEIPRLIKALMPFAPEVVHVILSRGFRRGQFTAVGAALQAFRLPMVVSTGEGFESAPHWPGLGAWLNPGHAEISPPPLLFSADTDVQPAPGTIFIPGPLSALRHWRRTLREVHASASRPGPLTWRLGFDWSEIPLPERLEWRQMFSGLAAGKLVTLGTLSLEEQIRAARACEKVQLKELDPAGWTHALLSESLSRTDANPVDAAINGLTRTYLDVARRPVAGRSKGMA